MNALPALYVLGLFLQSQAVSGTVDPVATTDIIRTQNAQVCFSETPVLQCPYTAPIATKTRREAVGSLL
ncbi:hypothetical protein ElyMa_004633600 [Elysia marginata]|uniref:Uncharacterized protein n=1 Tax=Elysia marginata TaxID=1093978 RepID=A0AAV4HZQ2_9GAST|nr:hypothetical protein ElyMa_004633600 [Elysia marginata]